MCTFLMGPEKGWLPRKPFPNQGGGWGGGGAGHSGMPYLPHLTQSPPAAAAVRWEGSKLAFS